VVSESCCQSEFVRSNALASPLAARDGRFGSTGVIHRWLINLTPQTPAAHLNTPHVSSWLCCSSPCYAGQAAISTICHGLRYVSGLFYQNCLWSRRERSLFLERFSSAAFVSLPYRVDEGGTQVHGTKYHLRQTFTVAYDHNT
jgi:hypothetical protein